MNRAEHLYQLLCQKNPSCTYDIWREMDTAPMRGFHEAKEAGLPVTNLYDENGKKVMCRHNGKSYAVYALITQSQLSQVFQELQKTKGTEPVLRAARPEEPKPAQLTLLSVRSKSK